MTMNIHHGKHHAAYIKNLGDALKAANLPQNHVMKLIADLSAVPEAQRTLVRNNGGGHVNHSWFWNWMAPAGSGPKGPEGKLGEAIQGTFGSRCWNEAFWLRLGMVDHHEGRQTQSDLHTEPRQPADEGHRR
jgi:superoxide dismutase